MTELTEEVPWFNELFVTFSDLRLVPSHLQVKVDKGVPTTKHLVNGEMFINMAQSYSKQVVAEFLRLGNRSHGRELSNNLAELSQLYRLAVRQGKPKVHPFVTSFTKLHPGKNMISFSTLQCVLLCIAIGSHILISIGCMSIHPPTSSAVSKRCKVRLG